jgi:hypothetical protein
MYRGEEEMLTPVVTEISRLSPHHAQAALLVPKLHRIFPLPASARVASASA